MSLLEKTKRVIEENGWCQTILCNDAGEHCLLGAFGKASGMSDEDLRHQTSFTEIFVKIPVQDRTALITCIYPNDKRSAFQHSSWDIYSWNDRPKTKKKDVLAALDCAIEKEKSEPA